METKILQQFDLEVKRDFRPDIPVDLNPKEVELVLLIHKFPLRNMGYYGKEIHMEKGSLTYVASQLLSKELISKSENPSDSRSALLDLTESGKRLAAVIRDQLNAHIDKRFSIFTDFELRQLEFAVETIAHLMKKLM